MDKQIEIAELKEVEVLSVEMKDDALNGAESAQKSTVNSKDFSKRYAAHRGNSAMLAAALSALLS